MFLSRAQIFTLEIDTQDLDPDDLVELIEHPPNRGVPEGLIEMRDHKNEMAEFIDRTGKGFY